MDDSGGHVQNAQCVPPRPSPDALGFIIAFWAAPVMSADRFALAVLLTGYIVTALMFEERPGHNLRGRIPAIPGAGAPAAPAVLVPLTSVSCCGSAAPPQETLHRTYSDCSPRRPRTQRSVPMRRRDFIVGGTVAWALPAVGQQHGMPVIGYLGPESPERFASRVAAFREGLAEAGYVEGRNVGIEFRWADGRYSRLPGLAADLANRQVSLIAAPGGAPIALAAKAASHTIPVVFEMGGDPIALGVVESLARPGGHVTGVSSLSVEVSRKRLEFMHELLPRAGAFAIVVNPTSPTAGSQLRNLHTAAQSLRVQLAVVHAYTEAEFDAAFEAVPRLQAGGLVFTSDPYFANRSQQLAALAGRYDGPLSRNRATSRSPAGS